MGEAKRKLAAILSADVVGYSRLMGDDDEATLETLRDYRAAIDRIVQRHDGRVVNSPGDAVLAEFPSAVEAVRAAETYARRVIAILPAQNNFGHRELLYALVRSGKMDEARKLAAHILAVDPQYSTDSIRRHNDRCCRREAALVEQYVAAFTEAGVP
jgi:hypothetical protein